MHHKSYWLLVSAVFIAAVSAFSRAGATEPIAPQLADNSSDSGLVVTATRLEEPKLQIPAAIDAVSGEDLRNHRLGANLSEGLGRVPGLFLQNRYNYAQDLQVSSRGFGARASFGVRGVRLIQDGIPLSMPDGQGQTASFDLDGAGRVEVLRGPFAALYGNSSGGVIQLLSADAPQEPFVQLQSAGGEDETWRGAVRVGGQAGSLSYTANVSRFSTGGLREHSAARRDIANAKLRYQLDDATRLSLLASFLDQPETEDPLGLTQEQLASDPGQVGANAVEMNTRKSIRHMQAGLLLEHAFSDKDSIRVLGYSGARELTQYLANPSPSLTGSGGVVDLDRDFSGAGLLWRHSGEMAARPFSFTLGLELDRMAERRQGFVNVAGLLGDLRRNEDDTVRSFDQFALVEWRVAPRWRLSGGVRRSEVKFRVEDYFVVGPNPDDSGSVSYESTQPVLGALFEISPRFNVYASAGRGFETPTFAELAYQPSGSPGFNFGLRTAGTRNYELGIKSAPREHLQVSAALFRSDTDDDIVTGPSPFPGRNTFVNADRTRRQGVELAAQAELGAGFDAWLAYTFTNAEFVRFINFAGNDLSGRRIPGVPRHYGYAELNWRWEPLDLRTGLEWRTVSTMYANDANTAAADSYGILSWHLGLDRGSTRWQLRPFMRVENLFDKQYVGSVIVNAVGARYFEPAPGRTWLIGFTAGYSGGR